MSFLIVEILVLLILSAAFGGALVYWWLRRHFVDVSSEYSRYESTLSELDELRKGITEAGARIAALEAEKHQLDARLSDELKWHPELVGKLDTLDNSLANMRPPDLEPLEVKLGALGTAVGKLENTDLSGLEGGVAAVSAAVAASKPADLSPIQARLERVERRLAALRNTDLSAVETKLVELDSRLAELGDGGISRLLDAVGTITPPDMQSVESRLGDVSRTVQGLRNADLSGVEGRLAAVEDALSKIKPTDLTPVENKVAEVDKRVQSLSSQDLSGVETHVKNLSETVSRLDSRMKPHPAPDFSEVTQRLDSIEKALTSEPTKAPSDRRKPGDNLLRSASRGKPDNLKEIKGIGPKLEKLLHRIGAFYFWQVAEWTKSDVGYVDGILESFKGRITRDDWVGQARMLAKQPGSARKS